MARRSSATSPLRSPPARAPRVAGPSRSLRRGPFAAAARAAAAGVAVSLAGCSGEGVVDRLPIEMGDAVTHHKINYIELYGADIPAMKRFYGAAFGWTFIDWGPTYASFEGAGIDGGFSLVDTPIPRGGALVILYSSDLPSSVAAVEAAGGAISAPPFDFPGGRRFHFLDPAGNELAVWTKSQVE